MAKCKSCGVKEIGYTFYEEKEITNRDGVLVKLKNKYWHCLKCGANTYMSSRQIG
ncbi:MAG: hypothetical protein ACFFH0_04375 [Promethearchaeota archaeon]